MGENEKKIIKLIAKIKPKIVIRGEEDLVCPLTGQYFDFSSVELTYLTLEIMDEFSIELEEEDLANYKFCTIKGICEVLRVKGV